VGKVYSNKVLGREPEGKRPFEDLAVDVRIILN
jgi:hypothetical protein